MTYCVRTSTTTLFMFTPPRFTETTVAFDLNAWQIHAQLCERCLLLSFSDPEKGPYRKIVVQTPQIISNIFGKKLFLAFFNRTVVLDNL